MARPAAIGKEFTIQSLDDVDSVLAELSWLNHRQSEITSECSQQIDLLKTAATSKMNVMVSGQSMSIDERRNVLSTALAQWITEHLKEHFKGEKRSYELAHGIVGLRLQPMTIKLQDGSTSDQVIEEFEKITKGKKGIQGWITATLARLGDAFPGFGNVSDLLRVKIEINWSAVKTAYRDRRVSKSALESIKLRVIEPVDIPVISPAEYVVSPE